MTYTLAIAQFPFMYVAWRTWSHYKARNAAQLLSALIAAGRIRPVESSTLDSVLPPSSSEGGGRMLINRKGVERMVEKEGLPEASLEEVCHFPMTPPRPRQGLGLTPESCSFAAHAGVQAGRRATGCSPSCIFIKRPPFSLLLSVYELRNPRWLSSVRMRAVESLLVILRR